MNPTLVDLDALAAEIRTMPEVRTIHPRPHMAGRVARLLLESDPDSPLPLLTAEEHDGVLHVIASVGLREHVAAPTAGLAVGALIVEHLRGPTDAQIQVRILIATTG